jgi:predicted RNA-binding Zn ribbon-like protein
MERLAGQTQKGREYFGGKLWRLPLREHASSSAPAVFDPELVGDHPALDLLNTILRLDGGLVDVWQSDDDVVRWLVRTKLVRTGLLEGKIAPPGRRGALLTAARRLREIARVLVTARKANRRLDAGPLNDFLARAESHSELIRGRDGAFSVMRRYGPTHPNGVLGPLAEAVAEFLATADFRLVRRCEGVDCVLWFYDRTKAHRRRWCSMEGCGNRAKVARFRSRASK